RRARSGTCWESARGAVDGPRGSAGALAVVAGGAEPPDDRGLLRGSLRMVDQASQVLVVLLGRQPQLVGDRLRLGPRGTPPAGLEGQDSLLETGEPRAPGRAAARFDGGADGAGGRPGPARRGLLARRASH